jgi:signal transduction histidine kinase
MLSYKRMKWLILIIPTLTIGLWEYVRHEFLLPYISMELGNWLAPVIVFAVTVLFLTRLFRMMESYQEKLRHSLMISTALQEREKLARELHDGIAQSLFLIHVKANQMLESELIQNHQLQSLIDRVHEVNDYVRQAIANLRYSPQTSALPWEASFHQMVDTFRTEGDITIHKEWALSDEHLSLEEKVTLFTFARESLLNVRKHASATEVRIRAAQLADGGWQCEIRDNGQGFMNDPFVNEARYGLKMLRERAKELDCELNIRREQGWTLVQLTKMGGGQ